MPHFTSTAVNVLVVPSVWKVIQSHEAVLLFNGCLTYRLQRVQELCESRGGRPGLSVLMSRTVSVDVKLH